MKNRSSAVLVLAGACLIVSAIYTDALAERSASHSRSQSNIGFKGIGPRLGFVDPEGALDGTAELGVAFEFGELIPQLRWDGSISFWSSGRRYRYYDNPHNDYRYYDWTLRDLIIRSGVNYYFPGGEWVPYFGGGIGLHFYSWDYNNAPYYSNTDDSKVGVYIDGGIEHEFSASWTGQMQLQFDSADLDQTALLFNLIHRFQ